MRALSKLLVFVCSLSLMAAALNAQDQGSPDQSAMEAMWKAFATPGEPHAKFKKMEGTWSVVSKDYMMDSATPTISSGEAKFETVLDGRYLVQHYKSTMGGEPFEGMGITGYDNAKKKYVGSWVDNMGTGVMQTEGTYDSATKSTTEYSDMSSPMGPMKIKMVTRDDDENQFTFTMFMVTPDGKETKSMELVYKRKAS